MDLQKDNVTNNTSVVFNDTDKLLIVASHLGSIFFGFIPSLIAYLIRKDTPGFVLDSVTEALNWQITVIIGMFISGLLALVLVGFLLMGVIWLCNIIFCIVATVKFINKENYRYPLCLRLIK